MKFAAIIITNKIELNPLLLESLSFADEILIILDTNLPSSNPNVILPKAGIHLEKIPINKIKFLYHPLNSDFSAQRNFALKHCQADWILFVDDDEYVSSELQLEISSVINQAEYSGFMIRRVDVVYHQPLLHGETGNIKILRLAKRNSGKFMRPVHEAWKINGRVGELFSPLYHQKDHFVSEFSNRIGNYGPIDAKSLNLENKPFSWFRLLFYPIAKFIINYFLRGGYRDGLAGLFLAYFMAIQSLSVRIFQWENQN